MRKVLYLREEEVKRLLLEGLRAREDLAVAEEPLADITFVTEGGGLLCAVVEGVTMLEEGIEWTTAKMAETPVETRPPCGCAARSRTTAAPEEAVDGRDELEKAVDELDFKLIVDAVEELLFPREGKGDVETLAPLIADLLYYEGHLHRRRCGPPNRCPTIKALVPRVQAALEDLQKAGKVEEVKKCWQAVPKRRTSKPKSTPASTAADILEGDGGVLDRGDALGQGVQEDRQEPPRRKRSSRRRR